MTLFRAKSQLKSGHYSIWIKNEIKNSPPYFQGGVLDVGEGGGFLLSICTSNKAKQSIIYPLRNSGYLSELHSNVWEWNQQVAPMELIMLLLLVTNRLPQWGFKILYPISAVLKQPQRGELFVIYGEWLIELHRSDLKIKIQP